MSNLSLYHKRLEQLNSWLPKERISRKRNMALLMVGLQQSGSIYLSKIVSKWPIVAKLPSLVTRLNRFLNNVQVSWDWYAPLAKELVGIFATQDLPLIMDVTKIGFNHRLLSVSIAYKRRSLPLVWSVHHGSRGQLGVDAHLQALRRVHMLLASPRKVYVLADAGFESVELIRWLSAQGWHWVLRQKGSRYILHQQQWLRLDELTLAQGETRTIGWVRVTQKHQAAWYFLLLHWAKGEAEPWFLLSNFSAQPSRLIRLYQLRMWTEEMYGDMKGHGFDLEATQLSDASRIARLFLAVALTFVWLICLGSWLVKRGFRHLIDVKSRRDKSYFRLAWDWLEHCSRLDKPIPIRFSPYL